MKRIRIMKLAFIGLLTLCGVVNARNLFTPLTLRKDYLWYPFLECCDEDQEDRCFDVRLGAAVFNRTATKATSNQNLNTVDDGTQVCPNTNIAKLFTGKSPFYLNEIYEDNSPGIVPNPLINFAKISPRVVYNETGIMFGFDISANIPTCEQWRWGIRGTIPFVNREVQQQVGSDELISGSETVDDIVQIGTREPVSGVGTINNSFAMRLDILSALYTNGLNDKRFVEYGDPTMMASSVNVSLPAASIHVIGRDDGTLPAKPFSATLVTVAATTAMDADGSNVANDARSRFEAGTDYSPLGLDGAQQAKLFVVPTLDGGGISAEAITIESMAIELLAGFDADVVDFLADNDVNFDSHTVQGPGGLDLEAFVNYQFCCCALFLEGRFQLQLPIDSSIENPGNVFEVSTGNDGHVELGLGLAAGWDMCNWLKLYGDASYRWVLDATENVAGSFANAKVKNVGPKTCADINWRYFQAHVDLTIMPPCLKCIGFDLGYQFFWKGKDNICFKQATIDDFSGVSKTLNACPLRELTNIISHKGSIEMFTVHPCYDLFGGFSYVFGGKNVMKEAEWHVGMTVKF